MHIPTSNLISFFNMLKEKVEETYLSYLFLKKEEKKLRENELCNLLHASSLSLWIYWTGNKPWTISSWLKSRWNLNMLQVVLLVTLDLMFLSYECSVHEMFSDFNRFQVLWVYSCWKLIFFFCSFWTYSLFFFKLLYILYNLIWLLSWATAGSFLRSLHWFLAAFSFTGRLISGCFFFHRTSNFSWN